MQSKQKLTCIALGCMILLSGVVLLINVMAQAPKQAQISFHSNRDGNYEIYVMDADGKNQRNLTNHPAYDEAPNWFDPVFAYSVSPAGKFRGTWGEIRRGR